MGEEKPLARGWVDGVLREVIRARRKRGRARFSRVHVGELERRTGPEEEEEWVRARG